MMCGSKMTIFTGLVGLLSALATGSLAQSLTNAQSTETLAPSPLGTTTSDGAVLVTLNYCTVVRNTQCQLSVTTSASSAPAAVPTDDAAAQPARPVPTTSADAAQPSDSSPSSSPSSSYSSEVMSTTTQTAFVGAPAMTTTAVTAAAAGIKALPGAAWGVAILAFAVLI
ncbi:hypothetical protein E4U55_002983 [Claviceps digitariae]|nr:hypothetical protein E4U55_002983 [Claviceps digitariae]